MRPLYRPQPLYRLAPARLPQLLSAARPATAATAATATAAAAAAAAEAELPSEQVVVARDTLVLPIWQPDRTKAMMPASPP
mmetsp:Transcript_12823/g.40955  ORF Transcript_12823/g.40955 Transcript_12823/m.40955 type:complete len:81 (-) Transcript_12823:139-381(-)